jgi:translation initiation factor IF-2
MPSNQTITIRRKDGTATKYIVDDDNMLVNAQTGEKSDMRMTPDGIVNKEGKLIIKKSAPAGEGSRRPAAAEKSSAGRGQGKPQSQVFDGRSERDKRAIASASTPAVGRGSRKALTETLGDKIKGFEFDPSAETIDYSQVPKKKKKEIELPPNPLKAGKAAEAPAAAETAEERPARPAAPARREARPEGGREQRPARDGERPARGPRPEGGRPSDRPAPGRDRGGAPAGGRPGFGGRDGGRPQGGRPFAGGDGRDRGARSGGFGGQGGFGGKDEEPARRTFSKKNDSRSSGMRDLPGDMGGRNSSRADNLKDRSRDKNRKDRNTSFDEDGMRNGKQKKDPNRKGAFQKPVAKPKEEVVDDIKTITVPEVITIKDLADKMKQAPSAIIKKLFMGGKMVNLNSEISYEEAEEIAMEYEILCEKEVKVNIVEELLKDTEEEDPEKLIKRPPVVCVMGHVDHGKTSLLDAIRKTNVTAREAGGITQHIGAYMVEIGGRKITFLDTPGHEAFTSMRMRGAKSTDIAILVVAADDGVMPQTVEAINHAKAAGVQIIVAVNKIDKPSANIDRVKQELSEYELISEDWGGSTVFAPVSAKTGDGLDNLLDMILLTADVLELKADPDRKARGVVIEAQLDKGRGPVATVLVQKGTLHIGDFVSAGAAHGKVRAMINDKGENVKTAGPSTPVEILGLSSVPEAGEVFLAHASDKEAKSYADTYTAENKKQKLAETQGRMSLEDLFSKIKEENLKELDIIIKADVQGSVEALKESLLKLSNEEVVVKVIHSGVGAINESDVSLAGASNAIIIGFNVKPDSAAGDKAEQENVDVRCYDVIYKAIEDVERAMKGMLDPVFEEKILGHAEIRQIFKASAIGNIAGSYVLDGIMQRGAKVRITRGEDTVYEGVLSSLKRFKDDVKEVKEGFECGLVFDGFDAIKEEDRVEAYIMVEVPRT